MWRWLGWLAMFVALPAFAQSDAAKQPSAAESSTLTAATRDRPQTVLPGDILVEGRQPGIDQGVEINSVVPSAGPAIAEVDERAQMFARCAKKLDLRWLRMIMDGEPNSASASLALDRAIRTNIGCYTNATLLFPEPYLGDCQSFEVTRGIFRCRAPYDRGALFVAGIARYAPDSTLTRAETGNPIIQERLKRTEIYRNRKRFRADKQYMQLALCMVAVEPTLATAIVHMTEDGIARGRLVRRIVARTKPCYGNPVKFGYEPIEMRNYIVEAFYRWVLAARDVPTLLPGKS